MLNRVGLNLRTIVWFSLHLILILLGVIFSLLGHAWAVAVGTSLIATGIAGMVIFVYVARTERVELALETLTRFGLREIFDGRSTRIASEYDERCGRMREKFDVMGFGLSAFLQDHHDSLREWKRRADIRILVIDPEFPSGGATFARQRDIEEERAPGTIQADVDALREKLKALVGEENGKTFQVRIYRCLPSVNIFRVDDELFWGPYLMKQPSRNSPTLLVRRGGILFQRMTDHFDAIWSDDTLSVPI